MVRSCRQQRGAIHTRPSTRGGPGSPTTKAKWQRNAGGYKWSIHKSSLTGVGESKADIYIKGSNYSITLFIKTQTNGQYLVTMQPALTTALVISCLDSLHSLSLLGLASHVALSILPDHGSDRATSLKAFKPFRCLRGRASPGLSPALSNLSKHIIFPSPTATFQAHWTIHCFLNTLYFIFHALVHSVSSAFPLLLQLG